MNKIVADPFARPFAWSYSKLKNFETCPRRHWHLDMKRDITEPMSEAVTWGNEFHRHMANAIGTDDNHARQPRERITQRPLPSGYERFQPWVSRFLHARANGAAVYAEISLAITREFQPCAWFAPEAWFRTKVDVMMLTADKLMACVEDWKTGRRVEDSPQLVLTAIALMAHYPSLHAVRTEFVWIKEMRDEAPFDCVDRVSLWRKDIPGAWNGLAARVRSLEDAFTSRSYPARPSGLCRRHCPVSYCEHHG